MTIVRLKGVFSALSTFFKAKLGQVLKKAKFSGFNSSRHHLLHRPVGRPSLIFPPSICVKITIRMTIHKDLSLLFSAEELEFIACQKSEVDIIPKIKIGSSRAGRSRAQSGSHTGISLLSKQPLEDDSSNRLYSEFLVLQPPNKARVPLWFALNLRKRDLCTIMRPKWMQKEYLQNAIRYERQSSAENGTLYNLPTYYIEVSKLLMEWAPSDMIAAGGEMTETNELNQLRTLLYDLQQIRVSKLRQTAFKYSVEGGENSGFNSIAMKINGISSAEIEVIRKVCGLSMEALADIDRAGRYPE